MEERWSDLIFSANWSTHEEGESVEIYHFDGIYTCHREGHLVYLGDFDITEAIDDNEAIDIIEECITNEYDIEF
jgi:hypothetical protein